MSFPLVGNYKIKLALTSALKENRLPHAILIEGDVGTGRHTLADFIAKAAVCGGKNPPCNECNHCHLADSGNHPDVTVTAPEDGKKNIAVAQIRQLRNETFVKPHIARQRVFIIDCADTMNAQSQNALLKVLEEPPSTALFILLAQTKAALLETVISRCILLTLSAPEKSVALEHIKANHLYPDNEISSALDSSQNNIGKALLLLAGGLTTKTEAAAKEFLQFMLRDDMWGMLTTTVAFEKSRIEADHFFKDLKTETANMLKGSHKSFRAKELCEFYTALCELEKSLTTNINLGLLFSLLATRASEITRRK